MGLNPIWLVFFWEEKFGTQTHIEGKQCSDRERRQLFTSQGDRAQKKTNLPKPTWVSSLQNCGKINFCCLCGPVSGTLWWQPRQTNILTILIIILNVNILNNPLLHHHNSPARPEPTCPSVFQPQSEFLSGYISKISKVKRFIEINFKHWFSLLDAS